MKKKVLIHDAVFTPDFEKLKGEEKQICEGLWKILNLSNPEIAEKLDINNDAAGRLRRLAFENLEPFLKKSK